MLKQISITLGLSLFLFSNGFSQLRYDDRTKKEDRVEKRAENAKEIDTRPLYSKSIDSNFPSDIGTDKTAILIVLSGKKKDDDYLKIQVPKFYDEEYVFVSETEVNSEKYPINKFRYMIKFEKNSQFTNKDGRVSATGSVYTLIDRVNVKEYPSLQSVLFKLSVREYYQNLSTEIDHNRNPLKYRLN